MKNILYATDCSKHAEPALRYVYKLCEILEASLTILNVYHYDLLQAKARLSDEPLVLSPYHEQMEVLKNYCSRYLSIASPVIQLNLDVVNNPSVSQGILERVGELKPDLLVVGMKDEHSERGLFAENIAHVLLEKSECPVLLIPNSKRHKKIKKIIYATDFEMKDIEALRYVLPLAKAYRASLVIIHVPVEGEYTSAEQMQWFQELLDHEIAYEDISFMLLYPGKIINNLREYVETNAVDLVVMLERKGKGVIKSLFHKDRVKTMGKNATTPVLGYIS